MKARFFFNKEDEDCYFIWEGSKDKHKDLLSLKIQKLHCMMKKKNKITGYSKQT